MNRILALSVVAVGLGLAASFPNLPARAEGQGFSPIKHEATLKECSACHMAFQPQMLPKRSWEAIMGDLANHFGEDASLAPDVQADVTTYLVANAADAQGKSRWMRRLADNVTPLRITETPAWIRAHSEEVNPASFTSPKVKSKANCMACHRGADKGYYGDD